MKLRILLLPLLFSVLFPFSSISQTVQKEEINKTEEKSFRIIEKVPIYPGCEEFERFIDARDNKLKECMIQKIHEHILKNYNTEIGDSFEIVGKHRITTEFTIDTTGKVVNIKPKAAYPVLEEEAYRVFSLLPQFVPAEQRGKSIDVTLTIPIVFEFTSKRKSSKR